MADQRLANRQRLVNRQQEVKMVSSETDTVVSIDYRPSNKQRLFHEAPEMFKLYGGAMGG